MGEKPAAGVITMALSAVIHAPRPKVWRALTTPSEIIRWDKAILELLEPADDFPRIGNEARWRYRLRSVPVLLRDRPLEVVPACKLRSEVSLGLFHFEQAWTLADDADATRLGLHLAAGNAIAVVGGMLDRFDVRKLAAEYVDGRLRSLRQWCEAPSTSMPLA
ncbi:MAG: SRPBCC family protein [Deltaproteobacteria bacterium]|nr:SRPBCC family protein [Deltaproteobacteria bacterium]MBW2359470.1 SRPBCC family protein [Deltaproteobacteria bacterium]